jgi:hypothetical protein
VKPKIVLILIYRNKKYCEDYSKSKTNTNMGDIEAYSIEK